MKVFISHKKEDSEIALRVKKELERLDVPAYLDVLDESITKKGKDLTDHIKKQLNSCTDIIVLMSASTYRSWWVPFEIGMSAQKNMPTVTFLNHYIELPDYLQYWPRLRSISDISKYVATRKKYTRQPILESQQYYTRTDSISIPDFYEALKKELR